MRIESYQLFAQLCEGLVFEASTSLSLVQQLPGGSEIIKHLHQSKQLAHNQSYTPVMKISWSELKNMYGGAWVIIQGTTGAGAIRSKSGGYEAMASSGSGVESFRNDRGGNILDFLTGKIGKLRKFYVGKDTGSVRSTQSARAELNNVKGPSTVSTDTLVKKFKPLWAKALTAAQADIKGMAANMIKNDAFSKAKRKLDILEKIDGALEIIESGTDTPDWISEAIKTATHMAASHYYPEQTGNIVKNYRGYYAERSEGMTLLLKDISNGDQAKLGTVLGFFKRSLISG